MKEFNVLVRDTLIHRNYLLEASAGTGKTFAVENLFVRLLVEPGPEGQASLELEEILAVTFTRAAARDLKKRIRSKIEEAIGYLKGDICHGTPDYITAILEKGREAPHKAQKQLSQALFYFDEAQIFTIHAFCHRALREHLFESGVSLDTQRGDELLPSAKILRVIQDFLRTEIRPEIYSKEQLRKLAKTKEDLDKLKQTLFSALNRGLENAPCPTFQEQYKIFCAHMSLVKRSHHDTNQIVEGFKTQAQFYNGICDRQRRIKPECMEKVQRFANIFNKDSWTPTDFDLLIKEGLYICQAIQPSNQKAKKNPPDWPLVATIREFLLPIVQEAGDKKNVLKQMLYRCQNHLNHYMEQEELHDFASLLKNMRNAVSIPSFVEKVRHRYKAAIIDEFQDTDPIQWEIFQKLFFQKNYLYLIGDPKQAIYSFRQADIYTYINASQAMGESHWASLDTNYRSQIDLVQALNALFSKAKGLMPLPRLGTSLSFREVKSGNKSENKLSPDSRGSLHFFVATVDKNQNKKTIEQIESAYLFPFIVQEIYDLTEQGISYNDCAVLVADRYQGERLAGAFKANGIPYINQRNTHLANTPAVSAMRELLEAVITPRHESSLKIALGGIIIGWPHHKIDNLSHNVLEEFLLKFYAWRGTLYAKGLLAFVHELMESILPFDVESIAEKMLSREGGVDLYHDLCHLAELLGSYQSSQCCAPEGLMAYLDNMHHALESDEQAIKRRLNPDCPGVIIQTMHSSKGLEFDIVFTLGLANRTNSAPESNQREEDDAEKMRLLYVALTRAKHRVYAPAVFYQDSHNIEQGTASPMELFLAKLGQPELPYKDLYLKMKTQDKNLLLQLPQQIPHIQVTDLYRPQVEIRCRAKSIPPVLSAPPSYNLPGKPQCMHSYSSLVRKLTVAHSAQEKEVPHDYQNPNKSIHTLPSGNLTGNLLHQILEIIPLDKGSRHKIGPIISRLVRETDFEDWEGVICQVVDKAIRTPLPLGTECVSLTEIDTHKVYRETEFVYAMKQNPDIEGFDYGEGFLKGVMDLVFQHRGKFYILDWKSNWLGPDNADYQQHHLEAAMQRNNYFLQAKIYAEALRLYLRNVSKEAFNSLFGGVIYAFLRGIDTNHGFYHFFPEV